MEIFTAAGLEFVAVKPGRLGLLKAKKQGFYRPVELPGITCPIKTCHVPSEPVPTNRAVYEAMRLPYAALLKTSRYLVIWALLAWLCVLVITGLVAFVHVLPVAKTHLNFSTTFFAYAKDSVWLTPVLMFFTWNTMDKLFPDY